MHFVARVVQCLSYVLQYAVVCCTASTVPANVTLRHHTCSVFWDVAVCCSVLQHDLYVLQYVVECCTTCPCMPVGGIPNTCRIFWGVALPMCCSVLCSVLHCAAVCCSVVQCVAVCDALWCKCAGDALRFKPLCHTLVCVAVSCRVLLMAHHCVTHCSVLQCVAVRH